MTSLQSVIWQFLGVLQPAIQDMTFQNFINVSTKWLFLNWFLNLDMFVLGHFHCDERILWIIKAPKEISVFSKNIFKPAVKL